MQVLFIKSNPHYEGMSITCYEAGITLKKGDKEIVTDWAKPDRSTPSDDEVHTLMRRWSRKWMKQFDPATWKAL